LAGLAMAKTDAPLLVAHHHQRREAEALASLDHLGHAVDMHELVLELAVALFPIASPISVSWIACHSSTLSLNCKFANLQLEAALARPIGQRLDAAVIAISTPVEHHLVDADLQGPLR